MLSLAERIKKEIEKLGLFQNPELRARKIYEFLRREPAEVRDYLQAYINDTPLTHPLKRDYNSIGEEGSD